MVIDAVVTWVDGADEAHRQKRKKQLGQSQESSFTQDSVHPTRFHSAGEIDFCLQALLQYAPWLRTIYIVTDGQIPPILERWAGTPYASRFRVVDHREIFHGFEAYLPTFNSLAIETMLWRIPGLSEHFIYFNDDCFLLRAVSEDVFFQAGKPVLRGGWKKQTAYKWNTYLKRFWGRDKPPVEHRWIQENSANRAGFASKFFHLPHVPFPLLKQTFADYFASYPDVLLSNIQHAFRHREQFWSISLAYHLALQQGQVALDKQLHEVTVNPAHHSEHKLKAKLKRATRDANTVFACVQSLDQATPVMHEYITHWLGEHISNVT